MTESANAKPSKKGCGPILVLMITFTFFFFGLLAGGGLLYAYLYHSDDGVERLNLVAPTQVAEAPPAEESDEPYALAYPLLETLDIDSRLNERAVRSQISNDRDLFKECYLDELERSPETRGEIDLQFSVDAESGDIFAAAIRNNHTGSDKLGDCLTRKIRQNWSFSAPEGAGVATVRFHTLFLPLRSE